MYSNNDFRSYREDHLEHASKYAGGFINGKNTSEYNHNYYLRNKWRWGVEQVEGAINKGKEALKDKIEGSETQLDDKALDAYRNAKRRVNNALGEGKSAYSQLKKNLNSKIDNSKTTLDDRARDVYRSAKSATRNAAGRAETAVSSAAERTDKTINRKAKTAAQNARMDFQNAQNKVGVARNYAKNQAGVVANTAKNYAGLAKTRLNGAIDRSPTQLDDKARDAARSARDTVRNAPQNIRTAVDNVREFATGENAKENLRKANRQLDSARSQQAVNQKEYDKWKSGEYFNKNDPNEGKRDKATADRRVFRAENAVDLAQKAYNRTLPGIVDNISDAIDDARKDVSKKTMDALDKAVSKAKDIAGFDERDRRDAAANNASNRPSRASENAASRAQEDYDRTPLGVAEKAYNSAKSAYDRISREFGDASDAAKSAGQRVVEAAENVYDTARGRVRTTGLQARNAVNELTGEGQRRRDQEAERRNAEVTGAQNAREQSAQIDARNRQTRIDNARRNSEAEASQRGREQSARIDQNRADANRRAAADYDAFTSELRKQSQADSSSRNAASREDTRGYDDGSIKDTFIKLAEAAADVPGNIARKGVNAASSGINELQRLIENRGWDDPQVREKYSEVMGDVLGAIWNSSRVGQIANNAKNLKR